MGNNLIGLIGTCAPQMNDYRVNTQVREQY